jgi:hypothetical protein
MTHGQGWPYEPVDRGPTVASVAVAEPVVLSVRPDGPPPEPPLPAVRTKVFVALVATLTVAVVLATFAVADWWTRNHELDVLLDRIAVAEAAQRPMQQALGRVASTCTFTIDRCDLGPVQAAAQRGLPALRSSGNAVATTEIVRFHGALRELRDRYVDHNLAWQSWLDAIVAGDAGLDQPTAIRSTWFVVVDTAQQAIPPLATNDARERVDRIFHA